MNNNTRTFTATYSHTLDGATLTPITHTLTVTGPTSRPELLTFTLDGTPCTIEEAARITGLALAANGWTKTQPATIGKARAHKLHLLLAREGYRGNHPALARQILGRDVPHFSDLTEDDARRLWTALTRSGVAA